MNPSNFSKNHVKTNRTPRNFNAIHNLEQIVQVTSVGAIAPAIAGWIIARAGLFKLSRLIELNPFKTN